MSSCSSSLRLRESSRCCGNALMVQRFWESRSSIFLCIPRGSYCYGQQMLETYAEVADVKPAWNLVLKQYDIGLVLIPPDHALASVLQLSSQWKRVYSDTVAAIFERVG